MIYDGHGPAIPAQDERAPTLGDSRITKIARIVDPGAFKGWTGLHAHCLAQGDDEETATRYSDDTHGRDMAAALTKARTIAALFAIPEEVRGRLVELVESWESGARISDVVVAAFQPELDAFTSNTRDNTQTFDVRLIRAVVDEKSNSERLLKDAKALRLLLAATSTGDQ